MNAKETLDKNRKEELQRQKLIANTWREFSKTTAYKELMDYLDLQDYFAIKAAKGPVATLDENTAAQINFDNEKAANLLQRSVGYDIIREYIDGYVNYPQDIQ